MHEIIVENVGSVYYGADEREAGRLYNNYAGKYKPRGCDWYASVSWIEDNDMRAEYHDPTRTTCGD